MPYLKEDQGKTLVAGYVHHVCQVRDSIPLDVLQLISYLISYYKWSTISVI